MAIRDLTASGGVRRATLRERAMAGLVSAGCLALLIVAATLEPSPEGLGTHEQLLPAMGPCVWHQTFGWPCATCGMTTSFAHAADGSLVGAARAQPFGAILAAATAVMFWFAGHVAVTGSRLVDLASPRLVQRVAVVSVWLLLAAWAYTLALHGGVWG